MPLITPSKTQIDFFLRTTKPFHSEKAAKDFFQLVLSYGSHYRPFKYGTSEPIKEIFDEKDLKKVVTTWLGGSERTPPILEGQYCLGQLMLKGRAPSKITYFVSWRNWTHRILFNVIQSSISKNFLKKDEKEMEKYIQFCDDLICMFSPVHAELYDYTSAIPCTTTETSLIPDDLSIRCPALKWRTYFGRPYIELLGRETILNAPCWKTEEIGDTIAVQLTKTVFEDIPPELREAVVEYFEASVKPEIRVELGSGFIFRPFFASASYDKKKKLVPEFPVREFFGKHLDENQILKDTMPWLQ